MSIEFRGRGAPIRSSLSARTAARAAATTPATSSAVDRRPPDSGFALYELILALAILGLVASIIYPRLIRPPGAMEIRFKAEEIAALLRSDRNTALREHREVRSAIDLGRGVVEAGASGQEVAFPRGVETKLVQSSRETSSDDGGGIRFSPDGRSSGGVLIMQRGSLDYRVSVNWLTGGVLVSGPTQPAGSDIGI